MSGDSRRIVLVGVGGPSSSGKTTVAKALNSLITGSRLIHEDDFYFPNELIPWDEEKKEQNWDSKDSIDFVKFKKYIKDLKNGTEVVKEIDTLELEADLKLTNDQMEHFKKEIQNAGLAQDTQIVLVDGFMLYHDAEIAQLFDIKIFFHASYATLKARREARKGYNTVGGFWVDPPNYFDNFVWPAYEETHRQLFIDNDVNKELNEFGKNEMGLLDFKNETSTLGDLIQWSIEAILTNIE